MKRRTPRGAVVPERLCRLVPAEWGTTDAMAAYQQWGAARLAWMKENHPNGEHPVLGDFVDVLRTNRATRHQIMAAQYDPTEQ